MSLYLRTALVTILGVTLLSGCGFLANFVPAAPKTDNSAAPAVVVNYYPAQHPIWAHLKTGRMVCAGGKQFNIDRAEVGDNLDINWQGRKYTLTRVATSTGAYRYEDKVSGIIMLQVPAKSQLLNAKQGQRLADECNLKN